jgi:hypothetical protein
VLAHYVEVLVPPSVLQKMVSRDNDIDKRVSLFRVYKNYKHIYAPNIKTSKYGNTSSPEQ